MSPEQMDVRDFREIFGLPNNNTPQLLSQEEYGLHLELLNEEYDELVDAINARDLVEIYDAIVDIQYILLGLANHSGLDVRAGHEEVHQSNLSKLDEDGNPIYRADGKVLKGPNYFPPRMGYVLGQQR